MTLTELRYVVAVARERHFGRAAEACFVSQPTLSVAVRKLEDELGVALFERSPTDVTVTEIGKRIVEQAQRVLEESAALRQIASQEQDQLVGMLRLGLISTVAPYLLPELVSVLRRTAPQMPLSIQEGNAAELVRDLRQGELDAVVASGTINQPGLVTCDLYEEPLVAVLPVEHPLTGQERVNSRDLAKENLLLLAPGHCLRDQVLEICPQNFSQFPMATEFRSPINANSLESIRYMVASGLGVSVFPVTAVGKVTGQSPLVVTRPFADVSPLRRIVLVSRKRFPRPKAIEAVTQAVRQCPLSNIEKL